MSDTVELPEDLRAALADGWQGLTLLTDGPADEPVTLVCAARERRLAGLGRCAITFCEPRSTARRPPGRLLVLTLEEPEPPPSPRGTPQRLSLGLDLAHAEARALVGRACAEGVLRIAWIAVDVGLDPRVELAEVDDDARARLRAAVALAGEWHVAARPPLGVSAPAWRAARHAPPRLVAGSFVEGPVAVVVPARMLVGVERRLGRAELTSPLLGRGSSDLVLRFAWDAPEAAGIRRAVVLRLDEPEQRRLAERLAAQRQMVVMGASRSHEGPSAHARVSLGPAARLIIASAAQARRLDHDGY